MKILFGFGKTLIISGFLIISRGNLLSNPDMQNKEQNLADLLHATAQYCSKLDRLTFDFICMEEITEKIDFKQDISAFFSQISRGAIKGIPRPKEKLEKILLYDYQLMRKKGEIIENRTLLKENGEDITEINSELKTISFRYKYALFAPVGIFREGRQQDFKFEVVKTEIIDGEEFIIIDAEPKSISNDNLTNSRVWVRSRDYAILKIEWSQEGIGNFHIFTNRANSYHAQPMITLTSEFKEEKNGIRFPSSFTIEEAYLLRNGKKFIRSTTSVTYRDFKFFTVEVDIRLIKTSIVT